MAGESQDLTYCEEEDIECHAAIQDTGTGCQGGATTASCNLTGVKFVISEEARVVKNQLLSFVDTLTEMSTEKELMDVTLKCGARTFKAHKLILCANSSYFRTMFHSGLSEAKNGIVDLKRVCPETFEIIMQVMYFGWFPPVRDTNKLKSLLAAAHLLQLTNLYEYCCDEYMKKLDHNTFVDIWNTAELYENQKMLDLIPKKLTKIFRLVQKSNEFLLLSVPQLRKFVTELGNSKYNSDEVLKSILYWIKHDHENRRKHMSQLLQLVDLNRISTNFLSIVLRNEDVVKKCTEVTSLFMDAAGARLLGIGNQSEADKTKLVVVRNMHPFSFHYYDLEKKTWSGHSNTSADPVRNIFRTGTLRPQEKTVPREITSVIVKDYLYCVSKSTRNHSQRAGHRVNQLVKYNLQTTSGGVEQCYGQYYDEYNDEQYYDTYGRQYEGHRNTQNCCNFLEYRSSPGLAALANEIYIVGGTDGNGKKLHSVERYDSVSNKCFQVTPMINPHCTDGVVTVSHFLYVADVKNSKITIERYDSKTTQWCIVMSRGVVRIRGECVFTTNNLLQSKVATCAGKLFFVQNNKLVAYDPDSNYWKQIKTGNKTIAKIVGMSNPKMECNYLMLLTENNQLYQFHSSDNSIRHMTTLQLESMCYGTLAVF